MSKQLGIKEVLDMSFQNFTTGDPLYYVNYAMSSEIDNAATRIFLNGGRGNGRLLSFDHTKTATMKLDLPLVDISLIASLSGESVVTGAKEILNREVLTVTAGAAALAATPVVGASIYVYYLDGQRDNGTALTPIGSTPASGQYSITSGNLTFSTTDNGKQVVVWYQYNTPNTAVSFTNKVNKFAIPMKATGSGIATDQVTGADRACTFTIYNCKFQPNYNFTLNATAATQLQLMLDMFAVTQGNDLVYYDVVFLA